MPTFMTGIFLFLFPHFIISWCKSATSMTDLANEYGKHFLRWVTKATKGRDKKEEEILSQ